MKTELVLLFIFILLFVGCVSEEENSLLGKWENSEYQIGFEFFENGTCAFISSNELAFSDYVINKDTIVFISHDGLFSTKFRFNNTDTLILSFPADNTTYVKVEI